MQKILIFLPDIKIIGKGRRCATFILAIADQRIIVKQEFQPENDRIDLIHLGGIENENQILIGQGKDAPGDFRDDFFKRANGRANMMVTAVKGQQF